MSDIEPADTKLRWFRRLGNALRRILPEWLRRFLRNQLFGVTPDVPITLLDLSRDAPPVRALRAGVVLGWIFCLGGTLVATSLSNTLYGAAPGRLYFLHDWTNLINYGVICPAYIGLSAAFIVLVLQAWNRLRRESLFQAQAPRAPRLPFSVFAFLVIAASAALTTHFILECLDPAVYHRAAWYVSVDAGGRRSLNLAGVYYTILNFSLLLQSLCAFVFLATFGCIAAEIGRALRSRTASDQLQFEELQGALREFTWAYVVAKLLAATYIINAYTWRWEKPQGSLNLTLMVAFLAVFGVLVVSFPRYYIEMEWFQFKGRRAEASGQQPPRDSDDIRDGWIREVAFVIDLFFGIGFLISFWR